MVIRYKMELFRHLVVALSSFVICSAVLLKSYFNIKVQDRFTFNFRRHSHALFTEV